MSNFPNMSYCAFENTANAMEQIANMIQEAIDANERLDLNRYEQRPFDGMMDRCQGLIHLLEQYQEMVDQLAEDEDPEEDEPDHGKLWSDTSAELA
jgi:hypothetical protein